jgi:hypothetical protein
VKKDKKGREKNYNYYDSRELMEIIKPFIVETLQEQLTLGVETDTCYCMGHGKNYRYLQALNADHHFFNQIIPLEHPRYIVQYKSKHKEAYIRKYLQAFGQMI